MKLRSILQRHLFVILLVLAVTLGWTAAGGVARAGSASEYREFAASAGFEALNPPSISAEIIQHTAGDRSNYLYLAHLEGRSFRSEKALISQQEAFFMSTDHPRNLRVGKWSILSMSFQDNRILVSQRIPVRSIEIPFQGKPDPAAYQGMMVSLPGTYPDSFPFGDQLIRVGRDIYGVLPPSWTQARIGCLFVIRNGFADDSVWSPGPAAPEVAVLATLEESDRRELIGMAVHEKRTVLFWGRVVADAEGLAHQSAGDRGSTDKPEPDYSELIAEVRDSGGQPIQELSAKISFRRINFSKTNGDTLDVELQTVDGLSRLLFRFDRGKDATAEALTYWGIVPLTSMYKAIGPDTLQYGSPMWIEGDRVWLLAECRIRPYLDERTGLTTLPAWLPDDLRLEDPRQPQLVMLAQIAFDRNGHEVGRRYLDFGVAGDQIQAARTATADHAASSKQYSNYWLELREGP